MANVRSTSPRNAHNSSYSSSDDAKSLNGSSSAASPVIPPPLPAFVIRAHMNGDGDGDEDDEVYDDDDLNDELIPRRHSKKLPRDRIKKPGKKASAYARTYNKSQYTQFKPGCIHGKHGFGINFRC